MVSKRVYFRSDKRRALEMVKILRRDIGVDQSGVYLKFLWGFLAVPQGNHADRLVRRAYDRIVQYNYKNRSLLHRNRTYYHNAYSLVGQALYVKDNFPFFLDAAVVVSMALHLSADLNMTVLETEAEGAELAWRETFRLADPINYDILRGIALKYQLYD